MPRVYAPSAATILGCSGMLVVVQMLGRGRIFPRQVPRWYSPFALELGDVRGGNLRHGDDRAFLFRGFPSHNSQSDLKALLRIGRRRLVHCAVDQPITDRLDAILAAASANHLYCG